MSRSGRSISRALLVLTLLGAATGLDRAFPPLPEPAPAARIELGRLLFFDPILSGDRTLSCAHCHDPGRGLADGRPRALGAGGRELARNTPTLYNAPSPWLLIATSALIYTAAVPWSWLMCDLPQLPNALL